MAQQFVEIFVVVGHFCPAICNRQIVVHSDAALRGLAVLGGKIVLVDLCSLVLSSQTVEGDSPVDVVASPLPVYIVGISTIALLILSDEFTITVYPQNSIPERMGLVAVVSNVHHTSNGILIGCV